MLPALASHTGAQVGSLVLCKMGEGGAFFSVQFFRVFLWLVTRRPSRAEARGGESVWSGSQGRSPAAGIGRHVPSPIPTPAPCSLPLPHPRFLI